MILFSKIEKDCLRFAFEKKASGFLVCDKEFCIKYVHPSFIEFSGWSKDELVEKPLSLYFDIVKNLKRKVKLPDTGTYISVNRIILKTQEKNLVPVKLWVKNITRSDDVSYLICIRKNDSNFRREISNEVLHSLNDYLSEGLFRVDEPGLIYCNQSMVKLFGYKKTEDLLFTPIEELFTDTSEILHLQQKVLSEGVVKNERVLCKRKNNSSFWASLNLVLVDRGGERSIDGSIIDISEQIKREEQIAQKANALEKVNAELDRFIYSASHDLRSPLSSMLGIINLMKMDQDQNEYLNYIAMLEASMKKLNTFVKDLTTFSQNSRQRVYSEEINFHQLLDNIKKKLVARMTDEVHMHIEIEGNDDFAFFSDSFRLQSALENVIKNSYDFHDLNKNNPFINVNVKISATKVNIEVFDNGTGIPKAHLDNVFDMFYRASLNSKGAGIGLYIAKECIHILNGTISISSEYGIGTCTSIEIPNMTKGVLINKKRLLKAGIIYEDNSTGMVKHNQTG